MEVEIDENKAMSIQSVQVISIPVSDQNRSKEFYCQALGFHVENDQPMGPTMRWLQLALSNATFTISLVTWFDEMPPGSMKGLMLQVDNVDTVAKDLASRGYLDDPTVHEEPWGRYVTINDPDNNSLILMEPPH